MQITSELGQDIIRRLAEYVEVDINIIALDGTIVASTDESRLGEIHVGAVEVIKSNKALILNKNNINNYIGTKPGANLPVLHMGKIVGVVGVSGDPKEILQVTGLIRVSVEIIIDQIYLQRQEHFKERQWSYWMQQLLHPSGYNEEKLEEEAVYSLNINTNSYWRVLVLKGEDIQNVLERFREVMLNLKVNYLFMLPFMENEIVIVIPSNFTRINNLANQLGQQKGKSIRIGVGECELGVIGIRKSYFQAEQALMFENEKGLISYSQNWKLERLIISIPKSEYSSICPVYENALTKLDESYIDTIDAYLHTNCSVKETASLLHVHRNTLIYRLDQIKEKVGLDPRDIKEAFILKIIRVHQS